MAFSRHKKWVKEWEIMNRKMGNKEWMLKKTKTKEKKNEGIERMLQKKRARERLKEGVRESVGEGKGGRGRG